MAAPAYRYFNFKDDKLVYDKEELDAALVRHITEYITLEFENVVTELLTEKLSEQKEVVLHKISTQFA